MSPLNSDVAQSQFLNLFVDVKLCALLDAPVYGRVSRQEMNYGSQRLLASPDWSNVRRSYDGATVFRHADQVDGDGFWLRPVNNLIDRFNAPDSNRQLADGGQGRITWRIDFVEDAHGAVLAASISRARPCP